MIIPFILFYQASATAEKGIDERSFWAIRLETGIGAVVSEVIMVAILVATIGIKSDSLRFASPQALSRSLASIAGSFSPYFFGIGLITASFIALIVLIGPSIILGILASDVRLMGRNSLRGWNRYLYWGFLVLIFAMGVVSLLTQAS